MPTLMLVDGNSLTYRAFHALPPDLATASGQVTNAVFGFTSMLINLVRDHRPDGVAVCFDRPEPTFRHERNTEYKANRSKAPDVLREQMGLVREVVETLRLPLLEKVGVEADDIIATLATSAAADGIDVLVVTGDRDSYQLVADPHVKVVYNKRGVSEYALYDEAGILERTGVRPDRYVQYAALRGDNSDNLPGVPGVGEKTAAKLIEKYDGIDGIYEHVDDQTPKLRENLAANEAQVRLNVELMELLRDVELEVGIDGLLDPEPYDAAATKKLFDFLEFRTLYERLVDGFAVGAGYGDRAPVDATTAELAVRIVADDGAALATAIADATPAADRPAFALAVGHDGGQPSGIAVVPADDDPPPDDGEATPVDVWWFPLDADAPGGGLPAAVVDLLVAPSPGVAVHDAKPLLRTLLDLGAIAVDARVPGLRLDTAIAAYLLDPSGRTYELGEVLEERTAWRLPADDGPPEGQLDFGDDQRSPSETAAIEALATARLVAPLADAVAADGLEELNLAVEVPLVVVLARMEHVGIGVDRGELEQLRDAMTAEAEQLAAAIQEDAGREFNVNSTKVLREVLFEDLGLTPGKKTKTGYSTDQATLEKLSGEHPIIDHLLRYREVEKLRSTYGESLLAEVAADDRIHATFNQTVARTGRLSSEHPNLHNIPVRTEMGRAFRTAFVPREGWRLLVADYNQIELRCIAHLADDPGLVEAFTSGTDVHRAVAARVWDIEPDDVDFEQRSKAKMVSYGLAYGMEAYGLGQRLGIRTSEAAEILESYFAGFPSVRQYMDDTVTEARNKGYTETLFGRRRAIPELRSDNPRVRQAGERQAMNAGIQGLAADIFKVALVRLDAALLDAGVESRLVLQVHDEVILEVPPSELDAMRTLVHETLSGAFDLRVPLDVNLSVGDTWADAKD